jgi:hypothetical protein
MSWGHLLPLGGGEPDPLARLAQFRASHPGVLVYRADFGGGWEAKVPLEDDGRGHYSPRSLPDLLDLLEAEFPVVPRPRPG